MIWRWGAAALRLLPPETAHRATLRALRAGIFPRRRADAIPELAVRVFGLDFPNPIGLAAGFDKDAEVPDAALAAGFGFVEVGTVTPLPQAGNPRPRLFRLPEDGALINRMGFNNAGLEAAARRLAARARRGIVGANVGRNKDSADALADYGRAVATLAPLADYLVVNISSPNTPGLRSLQRRAEAAQLLQHVMAVRDAAAHRPPLLVKVAPDLGAEERADFAAVALETGVDGIIVANTTLARPPTLTGRHRNEAGGLSGLPLSAPATVALADFRRLTQGRLPLVGVGGIASGADAYARIRAGASLVQLYTALVYDGPDLVSRIARDLAALLRRDGFRSLAEAIGTATHHG